MKYKVGDKVKIREDLVVDNVYGVDSFVDEMEKYKGRTAIITDVGDRYQIDIDNGEWFWTDEMLDDYLNDTISTVDVGYHLEYCGHRILKDVIQGETSVNRLYYTKNYDIQYIIPIDAIDFIIPHED